MPLKKHYFTITITCIMFFANSGHFTQVIWKSSRKVGFGVKRADNGREVYIVARYQPPGNLFGEFRENVPRPTKGNIDGEYSCMCMHMYGISVFQLNVNYILN
ncbi:unnamed protein product [Trichobilharzia regenti]|nr:unnamed protein product [Trichobilharzia regenti]